MPPPPRRGTPAYDRYLRQVARATLAVIIAVPDLAAAAAAERAAPARQGPKP